MVDRMGRTGILASCIFGSPQRMPGVEPVGISFSYNSPEIMLSFFRLRRKPRILFSRLVVVFRGLT